MNQQAAPSNWFGQPRALTRRAAIKASYAFRDKIDIDGFDHPRKLFDLTEVLITRGYSDSNIHQILGGNFRRLLGVTWA